MNFSSKQVSLSIKQKLWIFLLYVVGLAPTIYVSLIALIYYTQPCNECVGGRKDLSYLAIPVRTILPFLCGIGVAHASKKRDR
jgi:hypothetical protein